MYDHNCDYKREIDVLLKDNFKTFNPADYIVVGFDGVIGTGPCGMNIKSTPFTFTAPDPSDNVKFLMFRNQTFQTSYDNNLVIQTIMTGKQTGLCDIPFPCDMVPDPCIDYRLCCAAQLNVDMFSLISFGTLLTNDVIYALYSRSRNPSTIDDLYKGTQPLSPLTAAFTYVIPIGSVCDTDCCNGLVDVAIIYNKENNALIWNINGNNRYMIDRIGCKLDSCNQQYLVQDLGGDQGTVELEEISVGFGTLDFLDATISPHYVSKCCSPYALVRLRPEDQYNDVNCFGQKQLFYINNPLANDYRLFGQGANLFLKKQIIYTIN